MEKTLLISLLSLSILATACQSRSKKIEEAREKIHIDNPYEIETVEVIPPATDTTEAPTTPTTSTTKEAAEKKSPPTSPSKKSPTPVSTKVTKPKEKQASEKKAKDQESKKESLKVVSSSFPFKVGEKVVYSMKYFALEAGRLTFEVKPFKKIHGEKTYHFYISARTSSVFSLFYSVKDFAESFWSEKFQRPFLMKIYGEESKYVREVQTTFDWNKNTARYQAKIVKIGEDVEHEDKSWSLNSKKAQDVISALYYLRTFDLEVGETYTMNVAEKGKDIAVKAEVLRTETLRTRVGRFETFVVKPTFTVDGKWKQVGDILIWLTQDENKIPVGFEAKIKIGTIKGRLHSLKRP